MDVVASTNHVPLFIEVDVDTRHDANHTFYFTVKTAVVEPRPDESMHSEINNYRCSNLWGSVDSKETRHFYA